MNPADIERLRPYLRDGMTATELARAYYGWSDWYTRQRAFRSLMALERAGIVERMESESVDRNGRPRVRKWRVVE